MSDPKVATPEHECEECGDLLGEGEACTCQEDEDDAYGWRFLSPAEREKDRKYWQARNNGWED